MNKEKIFLALIAGSCFLLGFIVFIIKQDILLIHWSGFSTPELTASLKDPSVYRKEIDYFFWRHDESQKESEKIIWHRDAPAKNLTLVVNNWLALLYEENIIRQPVSLQSAAFTANGDEVFLSFNQSFLAEQASIYEKWQSIECLFKTIRQAGIKLQSVRFLVCYQQMEDAHLDFSQPWPLDGYQES